jgi:TPR repeat protein
MHLVSGPEETRDYARAVPLLTAACNEGFGLACGSASNLLLLGEGVPTDKLRAVALAERGCALDDPRSCLSVGLYFATDEIFPLDFSRAGPALVKACRHAEPEACRLLENVATNAVLARDPRFPRAAGLDLFDVACSSGLPRSCDALGYFLAEGLFGPIDLPRSAAAFERGCALDSVTSCAKLAEAYRTGGGVARDRVRARELAAKALSIDPDHAEAKRTFNRLQ